MSLWLILEGERPTTAEDAQRIRAWAIFANRVSCKSWNLVIPSKPFAYRNRGLLLDLTIFAGLFLSFYRFFYIGSIAMMIYLAYTYFADAFRLSDAPSAETLEKIVVAAALILPVISSIFVFKFFVKPQRAPRWKFLIAPQAERSATCACSST